MLTFIPDYDPLSPSWELLANSMSSFCQFVNTRNDVSQEHYVVYFQLKYSSVVHQVYQWHT